MLGLMQDRPLLISSLIEHAATFHPSTEIVSRLPEGPLHRTNWGSLRDRSKQIPNALPALGGPPGRGYGQPGKDGAIRSVSGAAAMRCSVPSVRPRHCRTPRFRRCASSARSRDARS